MGVTPGEWIMIITMIFVSTATVTIYADTVYENKDKIEAVPAAMKELKKEMVAEIQKADTRQSERMNRFEKNFSADMRDIRRLMMDLKRGQR